MVNKSILEGTEERETMSAEEKAILTKGDMNPEDPDMIESFRNNKKFTY